MLHQGSRTQSHEVLSRRRCRRCCWCRRARQERGPHVVRVGKRGRSSPPTRPAPRLLGTPSSRGPRRMGSECGRGRQRRPLGGGEGFRGMDLERLRKKLIERHSKPLAELPALSLKRILYMVSPQTFTTWSLRSLIVRVNRDVSRVVVAQIIEWLSGVTWSARIDWQRCPAIGSLADHIVQLAGPERLQRIEAFRLPLGWATGGYCRVASIARKPSSSSIWSRRSAPASLSKNCVRTSRAQSHTGSRATSPRPRPR